MKITLVELIELLNTYGIKSFDMGNENTADGSISILLSPKVLKA